MRERVKLDRLHPDQIRVAQGIKDEKRSILRCGRRWGKTTLFEYIASRGALDNQRIGWFGPTYKINLPTYNRLSQALRPRITAKSKIDQIIELRGKGGIEFWTLQDENAGRSRYYDLVIIDEASLVPKGLRDTWEQSIAPTLLDREGAVLMGGTPKGIDDENFFYTACTDKSLGFKEFHAPTRKNPMLSADAVAALKDQYPPLVYQQEYLAEFVDWRGVAFFSLDNLLVEDQPVDIDWRPDQVFGIIDTASKVGKTHDSTAVIYFAKSRWNGFPLVVLGWDIVQIEGDLLIEWMPLVQARLDEYANRYQARQGNIGVWIEDKDSGIVLLQSAARHEMLAEPLPQKLTTLGKDGRALSASQYVYRGDVKLSREAFEHSLRFREQDKNHFISQVCGYRIGEKIAHEMDLLDCFTYGVSIALGDNKGL